MDAQHDNRDIVFVFTNQGENAASVENYLALGNLYLDNVLLDRGGDVARQISSVALPTTVFYNGKGERVSIRVGGLSAGTLAEQLDAIRDAEQSASAQGTLLSSVTLLQ